VSYVTKVCSF